MTAGAGSELYEALSPPPAPVPQPIEMATVAMARTAMAYPGERILSLRQAGILNTNESRILMETWFEHHVGPPMFIRS